MTAPLSRPVRSGFVRFGAAGLVIGASLLIAGGVGLSTQGLSAIVDFFAAAFSPDLEPAFIRIVADAAGITLAYTILGTAVGVGGGFLIALPTANGLTSSLYGSHLRSLRRLAQAGAVVPRSLHEVIVALLLVSVLGSNPLVAVLGIGLPFAAITGKVYASFLDEAGSAMQYRQLRSSGAHRLSAMFYSPVPGASSNMVSYGFYRFECALRSAAVLGFIGAGGIGFQLSLSFSSLRYDQIWTLLYALIVLGAGVDYLSSVVRRAPTSGKSGSRWLVVGFSLLAVAASGVWLRVDPTTLFDERARRLAGELLADLWRPAFSSELVWASLQSIAIASLAIVGAAAVSTPLSFVVARSNRRYGRPISTRLGLARLRPSRAVSWLGRLSLLVVRVIPPPVWVLLSIFLVRPGVWPGVLALLVFNLGILGRLQSEVLENQSAAIKDQYRASGASASQAALYATIPSIWGHFVGLVAYRWEVSLRDTILVGAVGAAGLGRVLKEQISSFDYAGMSATLIVFVGLTYGADRLASPNFRQRLWAR